MSKLSKIILHAFAVTVAISNTAAAADVNIIIYEREQIIDHLGWDNARMTAIALAVVGEDPFSLIVEMP